MKDAGWIAAGIMLSVSCVTFRLFAWAMGKPDAPPPGTPVHPERAARIRLRHPLWWLLDVPSFGVVGAIAVVTVVTLFQGDFSVVKGLWPFLVVALFSFVVADSVYSPPSRRTPEERAAAKQEEEERQMEEYWEERRRKFSEWLKITANPHDSRNPNYKPM